MLRPVRRARGRAVDHDDDDDLVKCLDSPYFTDELFALRATHKKQNHTLLLTLLQATLTGSNIQLFHERFFLFFIFKGNKNKHEE